MPKRTIPKIPTADKARIPFDEAIKENMEVIMGQRGGRIQPLQSTATTEEIIAKMNEIIDRLQ